MNTNNYSESNINYDLNGNIKSYNRRGLISPGVFNQIDLLSYTYGDVLRPDRLTKMADGGDGAKGFKRITGLIGDHYLYDANGNMTQDKHKDLSFQYNYLNLPNYITNTGGAEITLSYTADGEKLTKVSPAGTRNYVSGIEYLNTNLDAIYHAEGRCTPNGTTAFHYEYTKRPFGQRQDKLPGQWRCGHVFARVALLSLWDADGGIGTAPYIATYAKTPTSSPSPKAFQSPCLANQVTWRLA